MYTANFEDLSYDRSTKSFSDSLGNRVYSRYDPKTLGVDVFVQKPGKVAVFSRGLRSVGEKVLLGLGAIGGGYGTYEGVDSIAASRNYKNAIKYALRGDKRGVESALDDLSLELTWKTGNASWFYGNMLRSGLMDYGRN